MEQKVFVSIQYIKSVNTAKITQDIKRLLQNKIITKDFYYLCHKTFSRASFVVLSATITSVKTFPLFGSSRLMFLIADCANSGINSIPIPCRPNLFDSIRVVPWPKKASKTTSPFLVNLRII